MHKRVKPISDRLEVIFFVAIGLLALAGIVRFVILADVF
jgi:hypothetical protein